MILPIVKYGDERLREQANPVPMVTAELVQLAQDMLETMSAAKGVGLAAEQVGRKEALCVIDVPLSCEDDETTKEFNARVEQPLVMFNPQILSSTGEQKGREGCLSLPNVGGDVKRAFEVSVQFQDQNGMTQICAMRGFLARAVQHEFDHLQGIVYTDRMDEKDRDKVLAKYMKMCRKAAKRK